VVSAFTESEINRLLNVYSFAAENTTPGQRKTEAAAVLFLDIERKRTYAEIAGTPCRSSPT
jgi:hypothetical protein